MENERNILEINIKENKKVFFNIEKIEGTITLKNSNVFSNIQLYLLKKEKWKRKNGSEIEKETKINEKTIEFIDSDTTNFCFEIPENINPSFEFPGINDYFYIRYYLCADHFKNNGICYNDQKLIFIKTISKKNEFLKLNFGGNISNWLSNKGCCKASVSINKNNFEIGEKIEFSIKIENKSSLNVNKLKVCLFRHINLKGLKNNDIQNLKLSKCWINCLIYSGEENDYNFLLEIQDKMKEKIDEEKFKNIYGENIKINDLMNTVLSDIIECTYSLKITIYFNSIFINNSRPRIFVPINISHKNYDDYDKNWNNKNNNTIIKNQKNEKKPNLDISNMISVNIHDSFVEKNDQTLLSIVNNFKKP